MTELANVSTLMNALNSFLTSLTDSFFLPWTPGPSWAPLVVVSVLSGIVMAIVFRFTSRQDLLRRDAELIQAQLLALKLFQDDLRTMLGSLGRLLRYVGRRLWHSLPPALVMTLPFVLLLTQLARWYENAPLVPGDRAIVVLRLSENQWSRSGNVALKPSDGFAVETPSLRDSKELALYWRIRVTDSRVGKLRWKLPPRIVEKSLAVSDSRDRMMAVDSARPGPGWASRLWHPGEPGFLASDPAQGIEVYYPSRSTPILGLELPWWATFLVVSLVSALVLGRILKMQF